MFKPMNFRFKHTIFWPGVGPANEIAASNILKVEDQGEDYLFVHASGSAVQVAKSQVTAYGVYDADDVPNLPTEGDYKDGNDADSDDDSKDTDTRCGGNTTPLPTEPQQPQEPQEPQQPEAPVESEPVELDPVESEPVQDAPIDAPQSPVDSDSDSSDSIEDAPIDSGIGSDADNVDNVDDAPIADNPGDELDSPDSAQEPTEEAELPPAEDTSDEAITDTPFAEDTNDESGFDDFTSWTTSVKPKNKKKKKK